MSTEKTETIKKRYNRISRIYDMMDRMIKKHWRTELLSQVRGNVLEVGVGTGANLSFYPKDISLTGIDFSLGMLSHARKKANSTEEITYDLNLVEMDVQNLQFQDNTFDYVVATCVYCSVPDPVKGMKEMKRVCKPDGRILLLEHMRSENAALGNLMDIMNPLTVGLWGANINRRTLENILNAGMTIIDNEELMGTVMRRLTLSPNK